MLAFCLLPFYFCLISHAMKKIVCPRCGAVNLEKFLSFPNCAGCAARLPQDDRAPSDVLWRRPLRVWLWVILAGGGAIGALGAAAWFQAEPPQFSQLLVYVQAPREVVVGRTFRCRLTLDEVQESSSLRRFGNVRVRLPNSSDAVFDVVAITPVPDSKINLGAARYYQFRSLPVGSILALDLRARQVGQHKLSIIVHADDYYSANLQNPVRAVRKSAPRK